MDEGYVVCMEDLGGAYQRLANNQRVGKAVKAGARYVIPDLWRDVSKTGLL